MKLMETENSVNINFISYFQIEIYFAFLFTKQIFV